MNDSHGTDRIPPLGKFWEASCSGLIDMWYCSAPRDDILTVCRHM